VSTRNTVVAVILATLVPIAIGYAVDAAGAGAEEATPPLGPGVVTVEVDMRYSRFSFDDLRVYEGTLVRFVVVNSDPINHELVVGDDDVHAAHATGHDAFHPPVPGEVSVRPGATGFTAYRFDEPGTVLVACHLPGHLAYGMEATVTVVAAT
jgi:uncharacterized cupredoxin-like copper-binding protein